MTITTFEEPSKTEIRAACAIAIEQAGFEVSINPVSLQLPPSLNLKGTLTGDLQSVDASGNRKIYFVRPGVDDSLAKWLVNYARASHLIQQAELYVVVKEFSESFKESCISAGAGLLRLTDDGTFEVEVDWNDVSPIDISAELDQKTSDMRRAMEAKLKLGRGEIQERYQSVTKIVSIMDSKTGDKYISRVEQDYKSLDDWGLKISQQLDSITPDTTASALKSIQEAIEVGPVLSESV